MVTKPRYLKLATGSLYGNLLKMNSRYEKGDMDFSKVSDIRMALMSLLGIISGLEQAGQATPMMRIFRAELKKRISEHNGRPPQDFGFEAASVAPAEEIDELMSVMGDIPEWRPYNIDDSMFGAGSVAQRIIEKRQKLLNIGAKITCEFFMKPEEQHRFIYTPPPEGGVRLRHLMLWPEGDVRIKSMRIGQTEQLADPGIGIDARVWRSLRTWSEFVAIVFDDTGLQNRFTNYPISRGKSMELAPQGNLVSMMSTFIAPTQFIIEWEGIINGVAIIVEHAAG